MFCWLFLGHDFKVIELSSALFRLIKRLFGRKGLGNGYFFLGAHRFRILPPATVLPLKFFGELDGVYSRDSFDFVVRMLCAQDCFVPRYSC